jgi:hypothetical protein
MGKALRDQNLNPPVTLSHKHTNCTSDDMKVIINNGIFALSTLLLESTFVAVDYHVMKQYCGGGE